MGRSILALVLVSQLSLGTQLLAADAPFSGFWIPDEIMSQIIYELDSIDLAQVILVNKKWHELANPGQNTFLWQKRILPTETGFVTFDLKGKTYWGKLVRNGDGAPLLMTHRTAVAHCKKIGGDLPSLVQLGRLGAVMGGTISWNPEGTYLHLGDYIGGNGIGFYSNTGFKAPQDLDFVGQIIWVSNNVGRNSRSIYYYTFNGTTGKFAEEIAEDGAEEAGRAQGGNYPDDGPVHAVICVMPPRS